MVASSRGRRGVDRRAHLLEGAAAAMLVMALLMSASVGLGFSRSNAATAMIIPLWQ